MSRENVELVRSILTAWERADFRSVAWADPEIEYTLVGGPEPGTWKGLSEMTASAREYMSAWENYAIEAEEYRDLDDQRVLALVRLGGRGKTSGLDLKTTGARGAEIWHIR